MTKLKLFLFTSAALLPAQTAFAQTDGWGGGCCQLAAQRRDDIVVVANGVEQYPEQIGRAVALVDRDQIEARQAVSIADLLVTTPGIATTRNGGIGGFTGVRIRGAEAEQTLVLIDGVRVNDPSAPGAGFDFGNLLAGSVERVEVLRGPNSVVWGSQAIGGVVNVITEAPAEGLSMRSSFEAGSHDQLSANAALRAGSEHIRGAVTAGYLTTDGISQAASGSEPDGYRQFGTTGRLDIDLAPGIGLDLRGYYAQSRLALDGFPPPAYAFADTAEYSTAEETYAYTGLRAELGPVKNRLSFTLADINRDNYDPAFGNAPTFFGRGRSERYAYQGDATIGFARLVFGGEREDSRFFDGSTRARQNITSVYGEAILRPLDQATLTLGARSDDHSGFGSHWSFGANAAIRPAHGTVLRASYGEGFKVPTLYQRFGFYGTPDLHPETARSYEFGAQQELFDHVRLGASWFHRDTEEQIDFDLATFTYFNIARSRAQGLEIELNAEPIKGLSLQGSYTHLVAENRAAGANFGNDLVRRPRDIGSLSAGYRFEHGPSIGATLLVSGPSFDDAGNNVRLDPYALAGIRAAFPVSAQAEVYGRVENLFDTQYRTVAGYGTYGRTAYAGLRMRFD